MSVWLVAALKSTTCYLLDEDINEFIHCMYDFELLDVPEEELFLEMALYHIAAHVSN